MTNEEAIAEMKAAAARFYAAAVRIGQHQFIEHAGLMNEHIKLLERVASEPGGCVWESTPQVATYEARYLGEKVHCIYGEAFERNPEAFAAFVRAVSEGK